MSETITKSLSGVAESLLNTLYLRSLESQRSDALIKDDRAVALVSLLSYDFSRIRLLHLSEANKLVIILRSREFDRRSRDFLASHPHAVVVLIVCDLYSRFERVDDGLVEWYDLDLPQVIALRRKLIGDEGPALSNVEGGRYHLLGCSVLDHDWQEWVSPHHRPHFLFLAEGVFMYFTEAQVRSLVLMLRDHFPGAELVFDAYSPVHVFRSNLQTARFGLRTRWGIWRGQELEKWGDSIRFLDEWGYFDCHVPRLNSIRWLRPIESLAKTLRIYHFQLGKPAG